MSNTKACEDTSVTFHGWATTGKNDIEPFSYHPRPLGPKEIEIEITHSGICGTDLHYMSGRASKLAYKPCIIGHEIVGKVAATGSESEHKIGDIVGVGCIVRSCGDCRQCSNNGDQYCPKATRTYNGQYFDEIGGNSQGGYADRVRVSSDYAFAIPSEISPLEGKKKNNNKAKHY
jgi:D-arabinose 1-dehydrogenase-like Zn-dependent alcohol dehydrogenase